MHWLCEGAWQEASLPKDAAQVAPHKTKGGRAVCGTHYFKSFDQFLFQPVAFSDVHCVDLLELV